MDGESHTQGQQREGEGVMLQDTSGKGLVFVLELHIYKSHLAIL